MTEQDAGMAERAANMTEQEFQATERWVQRALGQDLSAGTEAFRDELLRRCLAILAERDGGAEPCGTGCRPEPAAKPGVGPDGAEPVAGHGAELDDEELAMLAAAGSVPDVAAPLCEGNCHNGLLDRRE